MAAGRTRSAASSAARPPDAPTIAEALELEAGGDGPPDRGVVVDEQDERRARRRQPRSTTSQSPPTRSPASAITRSRPGPHEIRSRTPSRARMTSLPAPPMRMSAPAPPLRRSFPAPPSSVSAPGPPYEPVPARVAEQRVRCRRGRTSVSFPARPRMRSSAAAAHEPVGAVGADELGRVRDRGHGAGEDHDEEEGDATTHPRRMADRARVRAALSRSPHGA